MNTGHQGAPPTGPEPLDMKLERWHWLAQQGLGVIVLAVAAWYFEQRYSDLDRKLQECQASKIEALTQTVETNTETLKLLVTKIEAKK